MATDGSLDTWLGRVIEQEGRLLRVTVDAAPGGFAKLALTFDVGTVVLGAEHGVLQADAHEPGQGEAGTHADELDPWWTVLGNRLARIGEHDDGYLLQFREDHESPKILLLRADGGAVVLRTVA